jgi:threonine dehydrogenase-like Zn-dependent dehydrogenase
MKAVCWYGIRDVRVLDVPEPRILNPRDAIIEVTSTAICGSDVHIYNGYIPTMRRGDILGHEFMGRVVEVGGEVTNLRVGDRVVVPFTISCGECYYCRHEMWSLCDNSNPNAWMAEKVFGYTPAGIYGYSHLMGGYAGGQAEYVRVPFADVGPLRIPDGLTDEQVLPIADVLATGYMAAEACDIQSGDTVAVWGAGPVGQMAIRSALHLGAARVIAIDAVPERLAMAERHGAETINYTQQRNVVDALKEMTAGRGPDACIEAVGMESLGRSVDALYDRVKQAMRLETGRPHALREAIQACRKGGTVSIAGVFVGLVDKIPMGAAFNKGLTFKMGQTHVQKYMPTLLDLVQRGAIDPSDLFTHTMDLEEAPQAYARFAAREAGFLKVMLKPQPSTRADGRRAARQRMAEQPVGMPITLPETGSGSPAQRTRGTPIRAAQLSWEATGTTEAPPVPSQAEGPRSTIDASLCEKGLATAEECADLPAEEVPEQMVTGRHLPSQAEGERDTIEDALRAREEREADAFERSVAERRLPSQAEGARQAVEADLEGAGEVPLSPIVPHLPSQAEGDRETVEEDLRRLEEAEEASTPPTGEAATPPPPTDETGSIEERVEDRVRRIQEETTEPRDILDEGTDDPERR